MNKKLFVDIHYSFVRQPIKMAISNRFNNVEFTQDYEDADLILTTTDQTTYTGTPIIYLSDDISIITTCDEAVDISPVPTNDRDMELLLERIGKFL